MQNPKNQDRATDQNEFLLVLGALKGIHKDGITTTNYPTIGRHTCILPGVWITIVLWSRDSPWVLRQTPWASISKVPRVGWGRWLFPIGLTMAASAFCWKILVLQLQWLFLHGGLKHFWFFKPRSSLGTWSYLTHIFLKLVGSTTN